MTQTGEPHQPVRLYWKVRNRSAVLSVFRGLSCVWKDADRAGYWIWVHDDEASSVPLSKRPDEVPEIYRPIALARISFPEAGRMIMRLRSAERAIGAALFFSPRLGQNATPDRIRILNRLVTADEARQGPDFPDRLLDQRVAVIDPEAEFRRREAFLDAAPTIAEKRRAYEEDARARRGHDVPEVEDFPLAMEEETEDFTHLKTTLRLRMARAVDRWSGKTVTLRDLIYRALGTDPDAPIFPPETQ
jgi:hypothetical protein